MSVEGESGVSTACIRRTKLTSLRWTFGYQDVGYSMSKTNEADTERPCLALPQAETERWHARMFFLNGQSHPLPRSGIHAADNKDELLWVDITAPTNETLVALREQLHIANSLWPLMSDWRAAPRLANTHDQFAVQAFFARHEGALRFDGVPIILMAGPGFIVSLHPSEIDFIETLLRREGDDGALGSLDAAQFLCSLLDWQLASFHAGVSHFEAEVERIEEAILNDRLDERTDAIAGLRNAGSRLRRMLEAHRTVFAAMARPDFRPQEGGSSAGAFQHLYQNFHHAMQDVEGMRETVGGTLALITNQVTLRTSRAMRLLTFVTMIFGMVAIVTGALGMNFELPIYKSGWNAFGITVGLLAFACATLLWWGRRRHWY